MAIRVRAADGSVQTFPDGTSPGAVRMAMLAYDNKEDWGGLAKQVGKAIGQTPDASGTESRSAGSFASSAPGNPAFEQTSQDELRSARAMFAGMPQHPDDPLQRVNVQRSPQTGFAAATAGALGPLREPLQKALAKIEQQAANKKLPSPSAHPIRDVLVRSLWDQNTGAGLKAAAWSYLAGKLMGTGPKFTYGDNALQMLNSPINLDQRAYSLGDVQIYPVGQEPNDYTKSYQGGVTERLGRHEGAHPLQAKALGLAYLPVVGLEAWLNGDNSRVEAGADRFAQGRSLNGF